MFLFHNRFISLKNPQTFQIFLFSYASRICVFGMWLREKQERHKYLTKEYT